jgi:hypothetical protein
MKHKLSGLSMGTDKDETTVNGKTNMINLIQPSLPLKRLTLSNRQRMLLGVTFLLISLMAIVYYQYNRQAPEITNVAGQTVSADALLNAFSTNEELANKLYLNKVVQVTGNVTEIKHGTANTVQVLLNADDPMSTIACTMEKSKQQVMAGQTITVKGICTGYLNDVVLIECILVSSQK